MSNNEDLNEKKEIENEETAALAAQSSEEAAENEDAGDGVPFDEESLLELAQKEGLAEGGLEEAAAEADAPASKDAMASLTDEQKSGISASIETLLFMSDKPVSLPRLRSTIAPEVPLSVFRVLMANLREEYAKDHRGIEITEVSLGFQLRTKPHMVGILRKLVKTQPLKLSPASMEVLAVAAYKQPVTKDELDQIRGVDSGYVLRNLMEKRLIRILGRSELPGKPMVYGTTHEFLELFSLKDLKSLPPLHEVEAMVASSEVGVQDREKEHFENFAKMVDSSTEPLFQDGELDTELESLKADIAQISTSTPFIESQKAREKEIANLLATGQPLPEGMAQPSFNPFEFQVPAQEPAVDAGTAEAQAHVEAVVEATMAMADAPIEAGDIAVEDATEIATADDAHTPSTELEQQAEEARWERHASVIAGAIAESQRDQVLTEEATPLAAEQAIEAETQTELTEESEKKLESEPENTV